VDFGEILEKWEKQTADLGQIYDKDAASLQEGNVKETVFDGTKVRGERRSRLLRKNPDDFIDLHGLSRDEAWMALEVFFENSRRKGCEKVLIIHGKGNHRNELSEGALRNLSRRFIESCSFAGESGYSSAREGGTGATWVILKEKD
jgi:DNA-nicking Smr family endonuclease